MALAPDGAALLAARRAWERARDRFDEAEARLRAAEARRSEAEQAVREAQRSLMHLATRHGLPADGPGVRSYREHLDAFGRAAVAWARRRWESVQAEQELLRCQADRSRADAELVEARDRLADADRDHRELSVRLETLEASVGAEYREVLARIEVGEDFEEEIPSAALYYNLGNAHFLADHLPESILAYARGLRLDPNDRVLGLYRVEFYLDMLWSSARSATDKSLPTPARPRRTVERLLDQHLACLESN